jgi:hypothetical protein
MLSGPAPAPAPRPRPNFTSPPVLTDQLKSPWSLAFLADAKVLITEKPGTMRILDKAGALSPPVGGVPAAKHGACGASSGPQRLAISEMWPWDCKPAANQARFRRVRFKWPRSGPAARKNGLKMRDLFATFWWTWSGSNRRPLPCHLRNINHLQAGTPENTRLSVTRLGRQWMPRAD